VISTPSSSDTLLADPAYLSLKEYLVRSTGLAYYADKDADLARRVERRLSSTGVRDCASYLGLLQDPLRGRSELDELVAEITIGETYFFRHPEHFDALRDLVLPDIISRNRDSRSLRIWSAGCANGSEAYSLSILLKREMAHQTRGWNISILGTDINRRFLAIAMGGAFEEWSLRSTPDNLRRDCFSAEGKTWRIAPEYREWVSFQHHSLVEHSFPSLVNNLSAFDLLICRNVMIYFAPDLMQKIIRQFYDCLVPGAWLLVGPTEPNMTCFTAFRTVNAPGVTLYQKPEQPAANSGARTLTMAALPQPLPVTPNGGGSAKVRAASEDDQVTLADVRSHADRGAWESAALCCERLLKKDKLDSRIYFYHALILEQMRKHADAEKSLRRAIYLDRQSVLAHYYLGLFLQSRGDSRQAARSFECALDLLRSHQDTDTFPDADGISAAEIKKLAGAHLEILREQA
jgi:chemotaxis protein methyltransferase CheR